MESTTVTVRFTPVAAHVRTARLVAAAVARRSGVEEGVLDEIRLAVGEACSRAVDLHRRYSLDEPVTVTLIDGKSTFSVEVVDLAPEQGDPADTLDRLSGPDGSHATVAEPAAAYAAGVEGLDETLGDVLGLAVIAGLVDALKVVRTADGTSLLMTWPLDSSDALPVL